MRTERPTTDMRNRVQRDREKRKEQKAKHKITKTKYSNSEINFQDHSEEEIERVKSKIANDSIRLKKRNQFILGGTILVLIIIILSLVMIF